MLVVSKRGPAKRSYGIDPRCRAIADEVFANASSEAKMSEVVPIIERRCADIGAKPASRPTIYNWLRAFQAESAQGDGAKRIVVGRLWPRLVVRGQPDAFPLLLIAVALPEKAIVAHRLSFDPDAPAAVDELVRDLLSLRDGDAPVRPLLLSANDLKAASGPLTEGGLGELKSHPRSVQRIMSRTFGDRLSNLPVVVQIESALKSASANLTRQDEPITETLARDVVEAAIDEHNRRSEATGLLFNVGIP